ncbi:hypothetical protein GGI12_001420 [Dipsacomyces acuminosporus]|nr:hypothetical protein GGI12_001420 [Dipsacomyces acuminosporus]
MRIHDLGSDILHRVFSIARFSNGQRRKSEDFKRLLALASVCRSWRLQLVPSIYKRACVHCYDAESESNVADILSANYTDYTRELKICVVDTIVDNIDLVEVLDSAMLGQAVWPNIGKLVIDNHFDLLSHEEGNKTGQLSSPALAMEIAGYLNDHVPNIRELEYRHHSHDYFLWDNPNQYSYLLLPGLVDMYRPQLQRLDLDVEFNRLAVSFMLPQQLTRLTLNLGRDCADISSKIYAPALQYLKILSFSPTSTWRWFYSGDNDAIWFDRLEELDLVVDSSKQPRARLNSASGFTVIQIPSAKPERRNVSWKVHFPVLQKLRITNYQNDDVSFFELFEESPLRRIEITSNGDQQSTIPHKMLAKLEHLNVKMDFSYSTLDNGGNRQDPEALKKAAYENPLTKLLSSPSTVRVASLSNTRPDVVSLPTTLAWGLVHKLELDFSIDMQSVYAVLAQMPRLRAFGFSLLESYLTELCSDNSTAPVRDGQRQCVANSRVESLSICISKAGDLPNSVLLFCLSSILHLAPSLLRLEINAKFVDAARDIISDPSNSFEWTSQQPEVVGW